VALLSSQKLAGQYVEEAWPPAATSLLFVCVFLGLGLLLTRGKGVMGSSSIFIT
jgi:hypothetical protein